MGALADFKRSLDLNPNNPALCFLMGVVKEQQGDLKGALADYQKSRELKPDDPEVVKQIEAIQKEMAEGPKGRQQIEDVDDDEEMAEGPKGRPEKAAVKKPLKPKRKAPLKQDLADLLIKYFPPFGPR